MKSLLKLLSLFSLSSTLTLTAYAVSFPCCPAEGHSNPRPDAHAPISVMGDHTHAKDGWMLSYRYMNMQMDGMRHGADRVSSNEVFTSDGGYTVNPEWMTMDMHMLGMMYAPRDELTLMLMANYIESEMEHRIVTQMAADMINGGDTVFTTRSSGLGDWKLSALYRFYLEDNRKAHFGIGLSLPTGSIDEKDRLPAMGGATDQQMPAPMQLGSGTVDLLPSLTYVQQYKDWSWGAQANGAVRLQDENSNDYRLGHKLELLGWASVNLTEWLGLNGGLSYGYTGKLKGHQKDVNTMGPNGRSVTTAFADNYGGKRLDALLGANLLIQNGFLKGHRLAFDLRLPLRQDLNGYQLETDSVLSIGWQKSF